MMSRITPTLEQLPPGVSQGLRHLSADAIGAFGPTPLSKLVTAYLSVFAELRRLGAGWAQIAELLAGLGILGISGPIAADVLRATYARACATAARAAVKRNGTQQVATKHRWTEPNEAASLSGPADQNEMHPNATERDAASKIATQRSAGNLDEPSCGGTGSSLRKRAALLNRPTQTR